MTKRPLAAQLALGCLLVLASQIQAQDILRQRANASPQPNLNNPLANIQLPPQLASLTPQQLHQLAQLRELQLQQQAAAGGRQDSSQNPSQSNNVAPAPIGAELQPTMQPAAAAAAAAAAVSQAEPKDSERLDDGSYNESGSEMEGVVQSGGEQNAAAGEPAASSATGSGGQSAPASGAAQAPNFEVNWNKCPQLEPSESEKDKKTQVITKCLQSAPIPSNLTRENVETHREQIATCALRVEGWFDEQGLYRYDKAEQEIRGKKLEPAIEIQVLKFHVACREEANKKFPRVDNKLIDQVQFYQACMDYYISIVCEIEVSVDQ